MAEDILKVGVSEGVDTKDQIVVDPHPEAPAEPVTPEAPTTATEGDKE